MQAILGTSTVVSGLACTPTGPASLQVLVGPGTIYAQENVDGTAYGSIGSDTTHQIVKQGINLGTIALTLAVPSTTGQSVNYLIQAAYQDTDTGSTVLPYYNASNPAVAYNGPANSGVSQNTIRAGQCIINAKAGVSATTGTQTTPAPDAGFTGLWVVTVAHGATTITSPNIVLNSGAPFIPYTLPNIPIRTRLTANTTFYVSTTGSDSNNGLASTTPWLTLQHAATTIQNNYDLAGFTATVSVADGTYSAGVTINGPFVGSKGVGSVIFLGDTTTPTNCIISLAGNCFGASGGATYSVSGFQLASSGSYGINPDGNGSEISYSLMNFGACSVAHVGVGVDARASCTGNYTISGNSTYHWFAGGSGSDVAVGAQTITLTGTPAFSGAFANATNASSIIINGATFSGSATGVRYNAILNSVINTQASGGTYLPGGSAGTTGTGGQYA
jgi:hypothetical protein